MLKRVFSCLLTILMIFLLCTVASAQGITGEDAAALLYELDLFCGTGVKDDGSPEFSLSRAPTRAEAVTMLVRLLGKEEEALAGQWQTPFTDVPAWAEPYVGYAYESGLTNGVSETSFASNSTVTAAQYLTFSLRALGYESGTDFEWSEAWTLSDNLGLTDGTYSQTNNLSFLRADAAVISLGTVATPQKGGGRILDNLILEAVQNAQPGDPVLRLQAVYYGLPYDLARIDSPETEQEYLNNFLYAALLGDYSFSTPIGGGGVPTIVMKTGSRNRQYLCQMCCNYAALCGNFTNQHYEHVIDGGTYSVSFFGLSTQTMEQIYDERQEAFRAAMRIRQQLYEKEYLTVDASQLKNAQTYYDYLSSLHVMPWDGGYDTARTALEDSAYACLIGRKANCVGRAAAFELLLHVEAIPVRTVSCVVTELGAGHAICRLKLDGRDCCCDWGNGLPFSTEEQYARIFSFEDGQLFLTDF